MFCVSSSSSLGVNSVFGEEIEFTLERWRLSAERDISLSFLLDIPPGFHYQLTVSHFILCMYVFQCYSSGI